MTIGNRDFEFSTSPMHHTLCCSKFAIFVSSAAQDLLEKYRRIAASMFEKRFKAVFLGVRAFGTFGGQM
jgi:hypothetical protein